LVCDDCTTDGLGGAGDEGQGSECGEEHRAMVQWGLSECTKILQLVNYSSG
jgi:hypothetical protein